DHAYHAFNRGPRIGRAIRTDRYRMVEWKRAGAPESKTQVELYDYKEDTLEKKNIAASNPEVLSRMKAILARHPEAVPVGTVKRK
ncbi:MAG: iduronate-2-sulfatase, partial [Pirellulales bacterium]